MIVPVYKVEKYLPECIESVLAQTFTDFELILVDDGSPDSSGKICDDYASRDPRIRVFHKPNGGVSSARNLGLDNARGEWIAFVDADDTVISSQWKKFLSFLHSSGCVDTELVVSEMAERPCRKAGAANLELWLKEGGWERLSVCLSGFKMKIIQEQNLRFSVGIRYAEDQEFNFKYLSFCQNIFHTGLSYYQYRIREDSAMSLLRENAETLTENHMRVVSNLLSFCVGKNIPTQLRVKIFSLAMPIFYHNEKISRSSRKKIQAWAKKTKFEKEAFALVPLPRRALWLIAKTSPALIWMYSRYGVKRKINVR